MEMRAYPSDYLTSAQRILGDMLDFAVNTCDLTLIHILGFSRYLLYPCNFKTEIQPILLEKQAVN